jgi:hypothetical protein
MLLGGIVNLEKKLKDYSNEEWQVESMQSCGVA